jgi:hypothetical protein
MNLLKDSSVPCRITAVLSTLLLGGTVCGTELTRNPELELQGPGVSVAVGGVGLRDLPLGPMGQEPLILEIGGPIQKAMFYWGGRAPLPGDTEILVDGMLVEGELIGYEETPTAEGPGGAASEVRVAYAYRADLTEYVQSVFTPPGVFVMEVEDASPPDSEDHLNGASLLVLYTDPDDPDSYHITVFDGCDFAWAPNLPDDSGFVEPVTLEYPSAVDPRDAQFTIVAGDATPARFDRITITANPIIMNELNASDGWQWDSDQHSFTIPAGAVATTVEPISPPEYGEAADSLQWVVGAFRVPQSTGACCLPDGSCEDLMEEDCLEAGGDWQGFGTACATTDCPGGACCLPDGTCVDDISEPECTDQGGQWQGLGVLCVDTRCEGACCLPDGTCADAQTLDECLEANGLYQGLGTVCEDVECPGGACCLEDGTCVDGTTEPDCLDLGGQWQGLGVLCADTRCEGACCLPDGTCADAQTLEECDLAGGSYQGLDTLCDEVECPGGACCLVDGTCLDDTSEPDCIGQGGQWQGLGSDCATTRCEGACCLTDGTCVDAQTLDECTGLGGFYQGLGTLCSEVDCLGGACCLDDGTCVDDTTEPDCLALGGQWQGLGTACVTTRCEGACCLPDGTCADEQTLAECIGAGGTYQGLNTDCATVDCPGGACCLFDGACVDDTTEPDCLSQGGQWQGLGVLCADTRCEGACCLPDESCLDNTILAECDAAGGWYQGLGTLCSEVDCSLPSNRVGCTEKGSLIMFPKVELRWTEAGELVQDTFISITNDYPEDVRVQLYFVQGDEPLMENENEPGERAHTGWNWVDVQIWLTANEPTYWSALSGLPKVVSPWTVLDPGTPPGRPDPEGSGDRVLRGYIVAWAIDAEEGEEIRWDHLAGNVTIVNYARGTAWEHNACAYQVVDPAVGHGQATGTPGALHMDGTEYAQCFSMLLLNFQAVGSVAFSQEGVAQVASETDLTLFPATADLRQETTGPVTTKAHVEIWNMNEAKFSGTYRCITCWDQTLLRHYETPNHFLVGHLQTDHGKARIDGVESPAICEGSEPAALLGVAVRQLTIDGGVEYAAAGTNLQGMGTEEAVLRYDVIGPPPPDDMPYPPFNATKRELEQFVGDILRALGR